MFSKNINHQKPSILLILVVAIHLIHSTNGKTIVVMARHADSLRESSHIGPNESVLLREDEIAAEKCGQKLKTKKIVFDWAISSNCTEGIETMKRIRQEINQDQHYHVIETESLNRIHYPESTPQISIIKQKVLAYWTEYIAPEIRLEKNVLIVASGIVLKELIRLIENKSESQMNGVKTSVPFYYEFDANMNIVTGKTDL